MSQGIANAKAISNIPSNSRAGRILIVDPEKESCETLRGYLEQEGYEVTTALTGALTEQCWRVATPDVAVLDSALPDGDLARLVPWLKAGDPLVPVIILAKPDATGSALEALRLGAEQFLPKPVDLPVFAAVIQRALEHQRLRRRQLVEDSRLRQQNLDPFVGESNAIRALADLAEKAAVSDSPVLIEGERGTGKGLLALWLHRNGPRAREPFVEMNCGERSRRLLEARIFGDEGNAFCPEEPQASLPELAHRGTTLLSQIQKADLGTQSRLAQALAEKPSRGVAHGLRQADIRFIAASEENLSQLVQAKRFRSDLYSCVSGFTLRIPPLRERVDDLPRLAAQILGHLASDLGNSDFDLTRSAVHLLQCYSWPGNIRELKSVLERAVLVARSTLLTAKDLLGGQPLCETASRAEFRSLKYVERQYVEQVLHSVEGRVQLAAKILGVPRSSLYHKLKQYRMEGMGLKAAS
jgi:DNA-binding NtrC family response regulator